MNISGTKLAIVSLVLIVVLMTAFRPSRSEPANPDAVEVSLSFWGSYEEWAMWKEIVEGFHAKNPDIWIRLNYIPHGYEDKIQLLLAADCAPDIMLIQDEPFPGYAEYGKFEDLTDWAYGDDAPVDWDTAFWPTCRESFVHKGRVRGLPLFGGNVLIYYNRTMFRELGVEFPKDDWTFDEFIAKAGELTRDFDGDGRVDTFGFSQPGWLYFLPWTRGFNANYLNETCTEWAFDGPEALAATEFFHSLRHTHRVSPSLQEVPATQEMAMFMTGRIGMAANGPWNSPALKTAGIDFDVVHIPFGPEGKRSTRVTWDSLCMFSKCQHKEEAWRFMSYCLSLEAQSVIGKYVRSIPAVKAAKGSFMNADNGWNEEKFVEALDYAEMQPISTRWFQMLHVMDSVYELLVLDRITPEEAIEKMAQDMRNEGVFPIEDAQ